MRRAGQGQGNVTLAAEGLCSCLEAVRSRRVCQGFHHRLHQQCHTGLQRQFVKDRQHGRENYEAIGVQELAGKRLRSAEPLQARPDPHTWRFYGTFMHPLLVHWQYLKTS